jgi:hypothetical protein
MKITMIKGRTTSDAGIIFAPYIPFLNGKWARYPTNQKGWNSYRVSLDISAWIESQPIDLWDYGWDVGWSFHDPVYSLSPNLEMIFLLTWK